MPGTPGTNGTNGTNGKDGAPGTNGVSGYVVVNLPNNSFSVPVGGDVSAFVDCGALGKKVLGGGYSIAQTSGSAAAVVVHSLPSANGLLFNVRMRHNNSTANSFSFGINAVCATVQ